jgi:hypothetical protein
MCRVEQLVSKDDAPVFPFCGLSSNTLKIPSYKAELSAQSTGKSVKVVKLYHQF